MSPYTTFDLSPSSLDRALATLTAGGIVVCPSDTVYGLLVDATNESAVKKLIDFKERPAGKAISIFVAGFEMLERVVDARALTESARSLLPGPYTLVLPSRGTVSTLLESEKGTLGVRLVGRKLQATSCKNIQLAARGSQLETSLPSVILPARQIGGSEAQRSRKISNEETPQSENNVQNTNSNFQTLSSPSDFVTTLVSMFGKPVTATSANLAGKSSCYSIQALLRQLSSRKLAQLDLLIDAGELPHHPPSTVLDLTSPTPKILRGTGVGQTIVTHSPEETMDVAQRFIFTLIESRRSQHAAPSLPFVIYLHGDLGAGKTHFVKGIARHFGFDRITSPTYLGMQEYKNEKVNLYHVDLYNFESKEDVEALQLERLLGSQFAISNPQSANNANANSQIQTSQSTREDLTPNKFQIPNSNTTDPARSSPLAARALPSIICIEWPEKSTLSYPGTHVYMEYAQGNPSLRRIIIT